MARQQLEEYRIHRFIYLALGGEEDFSPPLSDLEINSALHSLTSVFVDLDLALKLNTEAFSAYRNIIGHFPQVYPAKETTQLARVILDRMQGPLNSCFESRVADWQLRSA